MSPVATFEIANLENRPNLFHQSHMTAASIHILHIEDDPNDALLFQHACQKAGVNFRLQSIHDGDEAIAYLRCAEGSPDRIANPLPQLILLDLKMPRLSGFDVLAWLRGGNNFKKLPVIVLTSSNHEADIKRAYDLGANSYLVKPVGFDALVEVAKTIQSYWTTLNETPA
jgi:CheY-like chemotaxis protein